jgi:CheY-like chemotaxis protein
MRILLVEHNAQMRRLIKSMIADIADEIYESDGDGEALAYYSSVRPDWVVMDIFREPNNGYILAGAITKADPEAKIVFVSNYTDERTRRWAEAAGGKAFFGKDDLLSLVGFLKKEKANR